MIFETNEDGFNRANVEAISMISRSTKVSTVERAYTGEKGIGFKSVFRVAQRVHIKSNLYSFSYKFDRKEKDCGYSTITPHAEPHTDMPKRRTRITLSQFDGADFESLKQELDQIPSELLLFLRQLKSITICIEGEKELIRTHWSKREIEALALEQIDISTTASSRSTDTPSLTSKQESLRFSVQRKSLADLPNDPARYDETTKRYIKTATVVVAFPLTDKDEPLIKDQYGYAFLPMRKFGFTVRTTPSFIKPANCLVSDPIRLCDFDKS